MLQRTLPAEFIAPCLPTKTTTLPSGNDWLHEIKHDGFRVIARKDGPRVRLYSRPGNHFTRRFPLIVEALERKGRARCRRPCAQLAQSFQRISTSRTAISRSTTTTHHARDVKSCPTADR